MIAYSDMFYINHGFIWNHKAYTDKQSLRVKNSPSPHTARRTNMKQMQRTTAELFTRSAVILIAQTPRFLRRHCAWFHLDVYIAIQPNLQGSINRYWEGRVLPNYSDGSWLFLQHLIMKWKSGFHRDVLYFYSFDAVDHKSDKASQFYNSNFSIIQACPELQINAIRY